MMMVRSCLSASLLANLHYSSIPTVSAFCRRGFRSNAAMDALRAHFQLPAEDVAAVKSHLVLYNYPSFSGAFSALFAHLFHSRLRLRHLVLPFSSVEPFRAEDFIERGFETCYLLDFIGPENFAIEMSEICSRVIAFDHRESTLKRVSQISCPHNLELRIDNKKSSSRSVYDYFSDKLTEESSQLETSTCLVNRVDEERIMLAIRYLEDSDLRKWELSDCKAFNIGLRDERAKLNCITNPYFFEQLMEFDASQMITKGQSYSCSRQNAANKLLKNAFKIRLGRGLYGECLAIRADGNSDLSNELGIELSRRSALAGLRPVGAVVFMQRNNLKMCLRSTDCNTDTSEIAKAYGGGGNLSSSSFIIRMDEYNQWTSVNP